MKTAIQSLIEYFEKQISEYPEDCKKGHIPRDVLNGMHHSNCNALAMSKKALEKEKKIIDMTFVDGKYNSSKWLDSEEYYNKTYNQNK